MKMKHALLAAFAAAGLAGCGTTSYGYETDYYYAGQPRSYGYDSYNYDRELGYDGCGRGYYRPVLNCVRIGSSSDRQGFRSDYGRSSNYGRDRFTYDRRAHPDLNRRDRFDRDRRGYDLNGRPQHDRNRDRARRDVREVERHVVREGGRESRVIERHQYRDRDRDRRDRKRRD